MDCNLAMLQVTMGPSPPKTIIILFKPEEKSRVFVDFESLTVGFIFRWEINTDELQVTHGGWRIKVRCDRSPKTVPVPGITLKSPRTSDSSKLVPTETALGSSGTSSLWTQSLSSYRVQREATPQVGHRGCYPPIIELFPVLRAGNIERLPELWSRGLPN
ncbi:unnamed protein product [Allacma fusca]|uniref:Uncharacterized protein n=1 Tax=Allacma fusca TaxID=39272 RepID=A0A8J2LIM9_9HEXA|nr:unnamed protein product [Allacma fusca]